MISAIARPLQGECSCGLGVFLYASERLGWQVRCRVLFFALTISWDPQKADALG